MHEWMAYDSFSLGSTAFGYYDTTQRSRPLLFSVAEQEGRFLYGETGVVGKTAVWTTMPNVLTIDEAKAVAIANWRMHHEEQSHT